MIAAVADDRDLEVRARRSLGSSDAAIYRAVGAALRARHAGGVLADIGCGRGNLWREIGSAFSGCLAVDAVRYDGLPPDVTFTRADLDRVPLPLADGSADVVAAVETIEHLENPWSFCRELARIAKPGGWVIVTTPNQLSVLSLLTLVVKHRFSAFQDDAYPAHRTALLESDLRRLAFDCDLLDVEVRYTGRGRLPGSAAHYPAAMSRAFPRALSDNVVMIGRARG